MPKRKKLTDEQIQEASLDRELRDLTERDVFIPNPPPSRIFKIGDRVQRGAIDKSVVTEVLDDGRIYKLHEWHLQNHYGKMIPTERDSYVSWIDITPWVSKEDNAKITQFSERDPLHLGFSQMDMSSIFGKFYHFGLDMNPDYQRGNVWDKSDKIKLINSIFNNVDIGKFVFITLPFKNSFTPTYEVLDGKQRIIAITEFYENRFQYEGLYFGDLCAQDQGHFERYHISVATVGREDIKLSDKYRYFLRLNVGGKLQDPAHIKAVEALYKKALAEGK